MAKVANFLILIYQKLISPLLGPRCRYYPSCSEYSKQCFDKFPFCVALWYSILRILRCHPFKDGGFDPVPEKGCRLH
ncbi:MAG: membrane protein insertion efficiency factor YidD [Halobacteriovorax sp.]|nr:membrane protein insertion efficiency factor YidD [Halobacteriovorax sp.]